MAVDEFIHMYIRAHCVGIKQLDLFRFNMPYRCSWYNAEGNSCELN